MVQTLEDLVRRPDLTIVEIVIQDEYTHDVVVQSGTSYLVYDAT